MANVNIKSPVPGSLWTHAVSVGQQVVAGTTLVIVELMKTEFAVESPCDGEVTWLAASGTQLETDDIVAVVASA